LIKNILTVDLEDYYCDLPFPVWKNYESRIVQTTQVILNLLRKHRASATFFTLGYIADRHPELIEQIVSDGHEIASHGYFHIPVPNTNLYEEFEVELSKSLRSLSAVSKERILGYRAPFFSINKQNLWAFEVLRKHLKYDSSIFPVKLHYDCSEAPTYLYRMAEEHPFREDYDNGKFIEFPITTLRVPLLGNVPTGGGVYFRLLPLVFLRRSIDKSMQAGHPAVVYLHPRDIDSHTPVVPGYDWHYYWGLNKAGKKLEILLRGYRFTSARDLL
jgi:polysaccharide deacetylase family protein (PEP-CTERM system associated)